MKEPVTMAALKADCAAARDKLSEYLGTVDPASEDGKKLMRAYMRCAVKQKTLHSSEARKCP